MTSSVLKVSHVPVGVYTAAAIARFPVDMTMVMMRCTGCGRMAPAGAEMAYLDAPGVAMRCLHCRSVLLTIVRADGHYWLNLPGVACLQIAES